MTWTSQMSRTRRAMSLQRSGTEPCPTSPRGPAHSGAERWGTCLLRSTPEVPCSQLPLPVYCALPLAASCETLSFMNYDWACFEGGSLRRVRIAGHKHSTLANTGSTLDPYFTWGSREPVDGCNSTRKALSSRALPVIVDSTCISCWHACLQGCALCAGSGSGEPSEEDIAGGRRSSRARRPAQRLEDGSEPGPSTRHSRFPSRLRATVHRCLCSPDSRLSRSQSCASLFRSSGYGNSGPVVLAGIPLK